MTSSVSPCGWECELQTRGITKEEMLSEKQVQVPQIYFSFLYVCVCGLIKKDKAACRAVFGTWGFFRTMHGKTAPSC